MSLIKSTDWKLTLFPPIHTLVGLPAFLNVPVVWIISTSPPLFALEVNLNGWVGFVSVNNTVGLFHPIFNPNFS